MDKLNKQETTPNVGQGERWASIAGGGALALLGLARRSPATALLALGGSYLLYRGVSGRCAIYEKQDVNTAALEPGKGLSVAQSVTINKPLETVFAFWEEFDYLERVLKRLQPARHNGAGGEAHGRGDEMLNWFNRVVFGPRATWPIEVMERRENRLIRWRSESENVTSQGGVTFSEAPGGRGSEVHIQFEYKPAYGLLGLTAASLGQVLVAQQVKEELRRLKQILETGVLPSTEGQPSGRQAIKPPADEEPSEFEEIEIVGEDAVTEASIESFPASDPPAWSGETELEE